MNNAYLTSDQNVHLDCEVLLKNDTVVIAGEVASSATVDHEGIARAVLSKAAGRSEAEFDAEAYEVISLLSTPPTDIANSSAGLKEQSAGNQGVVFGYATIDTPMLLPAPTCLAHNITRKLDDLRQMRTLPWLSPEVRSQVTIRYQEDLPVAVDTVAVATQHTPDIAAEEIETVLEQAVIDQIPHYWRDKDTRVLINPRGCFEIGGAVGVWPYRA